MAPQRATWAPWVSFRVESVDSGPRLPSEKSGLVAAAALLLPPLLLLPPSLISQMATLGLTQQMATLGMNMGLVSLVLVVSLGFCFPTSGVV